MNAPASLEVPDGQTRTEVAPMAPPPPTEVAPKAPTPTQPPSLEALEEMHRLAMREIDAHEQWGAVNASRATTVLTIVGAATGVLVALLIGLLSNASRLVGPETIVQPLWLMGALRGTIFMSLFSLMVAGIMALRSLSRSKPAILGGGYLKSLQTPGPHHASREAFLTFSVSQSRVWCTELESRSKEQLQKLLFALIALLLHLAFYFLLIAILLQAVASRLARIE